MAPNTKQKKTVEQKNKQMTNLQKHPGERQTEKESCWSWTNHMVNKKVYWKPFFLCIWNILEKKGKFIVFINEEDAVRIKGT